MTSGRIMENRSVMQLPVLSNTVMQLVKFSPGLQNDGQNRFFNMTQYRYLNSGYTPGRVGGNEWAIDGVPNIGQDRKPGEMPFTDVVEEFKVETSSFDAAAPPAKARQLYEYLVGQIRAAGLGCETGRFQEMMQVELVNDGPVTILLDSQKVF